MGGKNSREGIVEICINNLWGRVCTRGWDTRAANVTCRHAGFSSQGYIYVCVCMFLFIITNFFDRCETQVCLQCKPICPFS